MSAALGWGLAVLGTALGWTFFGWRGAALAVSAIVFWLLLQFSRALRALRTAGRAPLGQVPSAVMLHARLHTGLRLPHVLAITRSLGEKLGDSPQRYAWHDAGGDRVTLEFESGRLSRWQLERAPAPPDSC